MSCEYYNRRYGCNCCGQFLRSTAIEVFKDKIVIKTPNKTIRNQEKLCIYLAQPIPTLIDQDMTIEVAVEGLPSPLILVTDRGNNVYADQLLCNRVLHVRAITDLNALRLLSNRHITRTDHAFPVLSEPLTTKGVDKK